ncbi:MAG: penicillin acylase family protein [Alphaproteobacteria bacterium]
MVLASLLGAGCALVAPLPEPTTVEQRLAALPLDGAPVAAPVTIRWNEHQIPFVEAASDRDLMVGLGMVHAHLRLGQMEVMRRVARGRVSEMAGPFTADIDHALRILDFGKAAPATLAALPPATRDLLDGFVAGINHVLMSVAVLPHEFRLLGLKREPWTAEDVLTVGRLASIDINWLVWFRLMPLRDRADWPELFARVLRSGGASLPSFGGAEDASAALLEGLLLDHGRTGSNSVAVAGTRTASGAAMIASDPHLGVSLPNLWLVAGARSPSFHVVGLMPPGLPIFGVGRNPTVAWGGTNMRAASSDLVDVSGLPPEAFTVGEQRIRVRWWFDRTVTVRQSPWGPVVSDAATVKARDGETLALRWAGHDVSDEITAMFGVARATDFAGFRAALAGFHLPGQNMLYADVAGHVGQVMAVRLPRRTEAPGDIAVPPQRAGDWAAGLTAAELPAVLDPPGGFVASANNRPAPAPVTVGWFFSPDDRIRRLQELLSGDGTVARDDLMALQRDVTVASAIALRDTLGRHVAALPDGVLGDAADKAAALIAGWDGRYDAASAGAVAFEAAAHHLEQQLWSAEERAVAGIVDRVNQALAETLDKAPAARLREVLPLALAAATAAVEKHGSWGEMHRLAFAHTLANAPVIGDRYRFGDMPASGTTTSVNKSAHGRTEDRHPTRYGAQSRHVSDLADPDANWFVLLGGQDGWFNSSTFLDQTTLWRDGGYVQVPLRPDSVAGAFRHVTILRPAGGA